MEKYFWKPIKGYENLYSISKIGLVYSHTKKRLKKSTLGKRGYYEVSLWNNNLRKTIKTHRLIAIHFIDNPENKKYINHIDGNKTNNSIDNLEWCTIAENNKHAKEIGLNKDIGSNHHNAVLNEYDVVLIRNIKHLSDAEMAIIFGVSRKNINKIKNFKIWRHVK